MKSILSLGLAAVLAVLIVISMAVRDVSETQAAGVAFFTGARIDVVPAGGGAPIPGQGAVLPIGGKAAFSIPLFGLAALTVNGVAAGGAGAAVTVDMYDEDAIFDDLLDTHGAVGGAGGAFTIVLHLQCVGLGTTLAGGWAGFEVIRSSGEQTADVYVRDGGQRIPVGTTWDIACDKHRALPGLTTGSNLDIPWADDTATVTLPPGALAQDTTVRLGNVLPIPCADSLPSGFLAVSEAIAVETDAVPLIAPAQVSLPYTDGEIEGYTESALTILKLDPGGGCEPIPTNVNETNNTLFFEIGSFGVYGFAGPPSSAVGGVAGLLDSPDSRVLDAASSGDGREAPFTTLVIGGIALLGAGGWYWRRRFSRN